MFSQLLCIDFLNEFYSQSASNCEEALLKYPKCVGSMSLRKNLSFNASE